MREGKYGAVLGNQIEEELGMKVAASPPFFRGWYPRIVNLPHAGKACKVSQSPVIPLISGEWIFSHVWHEILRLSPHLFWLGLFTHRAFSSAQDDDTRGRKGSHLGDMLRVLELAVLYYDTSSPLEKGRAKGAGWIHEAV